MVVGNHSLHSAVTVLSFDSTNCHRQCDECCFSLLICNVDAWYSAFKWCVLVCYLCFDSDDIFLGISLFRFVLA